jgi:transcriptional regulator with XRE-family HTH domain
MNVGQRIREVREDLGMQAAVLARRVGVAPNTIYRIEAGDRTPSVALLEKIARELRTEPADLFKEPVPLDKAPREAGQPSEDIEGTPYSFQEYLAEHIEAPEVLLEGLHNSDIPASRSEAAIVSQYIRLRGRKPGEHSSEAGLSQIDYMSEYADEVIDRERIALLVAYVLERDGFAKEDTALSLVLRDEIARLDKKAES